MAKAGLAYQLSGSLLGLIYVPSLNPGYQPGKGLGKDASGPMEPLKPELRGTRSGLGIHEDLKRRRLEEQADRHRKAEGLRVLEDESRQRFKDSASEAFGRRKAVGQLWSAWRVCEQLEAAAAAASGTSDLLAATEVGG